MGNNGFKTMKVRLKDYRTLKVWSALRGLPMVEVFSRIVQRERSRELGKDAQATRKGKT